MKGRFLCTCGLVKGNVCVLCLGGGEEKISLYGWEVKENVCVLCLGGVGERKISMYLWEVKENVCVL